MKEKMEKFIKILEQINISSSSKNDYEGLINTLVKELHFIFAPNHPFFEVDLEIAERYYNLLYSVLIQFAFTEKMEESFLLKAREPLFFYVERLPRGTIPKQVELMVNTMISQYKRIILTSCYHCKFDVGRKEINDFLGISLSLQIQNFPSETIRFQCRCVVDLITWIFNLLQFKRIDPQYLLYIPSMLNSFEFSTIEIFDCDYELYDEGVNPGQMHEILYTRNYYIAMLLLFCKVTKKYRTETLIGKFRYSGSGKNNSGWEYKNVLGGLKNIVKADFMAVMPDYVSEFENARNTVIKILDSRIVKKEEQYMNDMKKNIDYEKVRNSLSIRKQQFLSEFDLFSEKTSDYVQLRPIKTEFEVSLREIKNDSSLHVFHSSYYPLFQGLLLSHYMNAGKFNIRKMASLLDIPCSDGETLLLSHKSYAKLYQIEAIKFQGNGSIHYSERDFKIEYIHSNFDGVILKSDFTKFFSRPELNDIESKIDEQETSTNISFFTKVDVIFYQNIKIEPVAYDVDELRNIEIKNIKNGVEE